VRSQQGKLEAFPFSGHELILVTQKPLARPVVLDPLGKMYNKDSIIEYLLDRSKYGDGDQICGYIKGVKVSLRFSG